MFGYILPDKPEMKIKEFEIFRAYYCGVCKSMGRNFGVLSRFALNYDSVFLSLFLSSVNEDRPSFKKEACFANPIKRKNIIKNNEFIDYAADINVLLTYYKLRDNWKDEKSIASYFASSLIGRGFQKAKKKNVNAAEYIRKSIEELSELEEQRCNSMDRAAEPFAAMMSKILVEGYRGNNTGTAECLKWVGYNLGKWIYLIDAYDDIEKDIKSKSYNPLLMQYEYKEGCKVEDFKRSIYTEVDFNLVQSMSQIARAIELLELKNRGIIENIAYLGLYKKTEQLLGQCSSGCCPEKANSIEEGVI